MRTTLTLDDDVAGVLHRRAKELGLPFKEVVNSTLRRGIAQENLAGQSRSAPKVHSRNLGLKPGFDPDKLNQLADDLEAEEFARKSP